MKIGNFVRNLHFPMELVKVSAASDDFHKANKSTLETLDKKSRNLPFPYALQLTEVQCIFATSFADTRSSKKLFNS
jgi:hypothetical protein